MKSMKKITAALTAVLLAASLTACSGNGNSSSSGSESTASGSSSSAESSSSSTSSSSSSSSSASSSSTSSSTSSSSSASSTESTSESTSSSSSESASSSVESKPESSSSTSESKPEPKPDVEIKDGAELLNKAYALFTEDEQFPAVGGSSGNMVDGKAGIVDISDASEMSRLYGYPAAEIAKIDSAACLLHMMNLNTFTAAAYHTVSGTDIAALAESFKANLQERHWVCGFPDKLIVASVGDYMVSAFGNAELIDAFAKRLGEAYPTAKILADEPIS